MAVTLAETFEDLEKRLGKDLIPIYKEKIREPLIRDNYGSRGALMMNKSTGNIMCHDCGKEFRALGHHIRKAHYKLYDNEHPSKEYRKKHGLSQKIPLCHEDISRISSKRAMKNNPLRYRQNFEYKNSLAKARIEYKKSGGLPISIRNNHGTCSPEQIRARMLILASIVKRSPSSKDARGYDCGLLEVLSSHYGSWNRGKKSLKFKIYRSGHPKGQGNTNTTELIAKLRSFVVNFQCIPTARSLAKNGYPVHSTYLKYFGSWNRTKEMAGLDQLLAEVKGGDRSGKNNNSCSI